MCKYRICIGNTSLFLFFDSSDQEGGVNMSDYSRITGLSTGLDTDNMIKEMMKVERIKVDRAEQDNTILEWEKEAYKEVTTLLRGFQSEFFDILKPENNLTSPTTFDIFAASVQLDGIANTAVSVNPSSSATTGTVKISEITQLATKDTWNSSSSVEELLGSGFDLANINAVIAADNKINVTMDGTTREIELTNGGTYTYADIGEFTSDLQAQLDAEFGAGNFTITDDGSELTIDAAGHNVKIEENDDFILGSMGFADGDSNVLSTSTTLADAFGVTDADLDFEINGVTDFGITADDTIAEMMNKINISSAGVTMSYSSMTNEFEMEANSEGFVNNIELTDTDSFFTNHLKLDSGTGGLDAEFTMNGVTTSRSSNQFTVDGVQFTLNETHDIADGVIEVDLSVDTSDIVDTLALFVEKYNEINEFINTKLNEDKYYDYKPLTAEEKKDMSDDDIEVWENKAKSGLLNGDNYLQNITRQMRNVVYESVEGLGISLYEIGITTSSDYKDNGKLIIDQDKLEAAIKENPSEIIELFTKESDYTYYDSDNRATRNAENGIANRLNDILDDYIRIGRDESGQKGALIEKAGFEKDTFDATSDLAKIISRNEKNINDLLNSLYDKENDYYIMFARLEASMSELQAQSSSLMASIGG